jgi:hypothetical protein
MSRVLADKNRTCQERRKYSNYKDRREKPDLNPSTEFPK